MAAPTIYPNNEQSRRAGVQKELMDTWKQVVPTFESQQALLMRKLPTSNIREITYAWKESLPFPSYWPYGSPRQHKAFKDVAITLGKVPYELSIPWSLWDERDDLLGDLRTHIQMAVQRYATLPQIIAAEYFNGTAVEQPSLYSCYDGAALFSAVQGNGEARMGVTGGNILTATGFDPASILADIIRAQRQFLKMKDPTAGKPIFELEHTVFQNLTCMVPNDLNGVFQTAANSEYFRRDPLNNVSEHNYMKGTFKWVINPFLTSTQNWYVILSHPFYKPFVFRAPDKVETVIADTNNSDYAREHKEAILYSDVRMRMGPWFPGCIIKISA